MAEAAVFAHGGLGTSPSSIPRTGASMTAPDFLPVLSAGAHPSPKDGACVMEYVSLLAGEAWSDSPACTHRVLAAAARRLNDRLPDGERQQLVPLIGRLFGTAPTGTSRERKVLSVRLAVWSARQVLPLVREQDREACEAAVLAAEKWCEGRATERECRAAATTVSTASAVADAASASASASAAAAAAADAAAAAAADASAADASAASASAAAAAAFLTGLLDEYDRLTGRTAQALTAEQCTTLAGAVR